MYCFRPCAVTLFLVSMFAWGRGGNKDDIDVREIPRERG